MAIFKYDVGVDADMHEQKAAVDDGRSGQLGYAVRFDKDDDASEQQFVQRQNPESQES